MYSLCAFDNYFKNVDRDCPTDEQWGLLKETGCDGELGSQRYHLRGFPPLTLRRSLEAFRRAENACSPLPSTRPSSHSANRVRSPK